MNVGRIKQLFLEFARALPEPGMPEGSESGAPQFLLGPLLVGRNVQSEIKYQLSVRVAHLLSTSLESRRTIAKTVSGLYDVRSKIVHAGSTDVSQADVESMGDLCLNALFALATLPAFAEMNDSKDLDEWFKDRMLGAFDPTEGGSRFLEKRSAAGYIKAERLFAGEALESRVRNLSGRDRNEGWCLSVFHSKPL